MPRKQRIPKDRIDILPSPAWVFTMLAGADPGCRLRGWVAQGQAGHCGEPTADVIWRQYREALIAEAARYDFEPYRLHRRAPGGAGFRRWRDAFLAEHRYY